MIFSSRRALIIPLALALAGLSLSSCTTTGGGSSNSEQLANLNTVHMRLNFNKLVRTVVIELDPQAAPNTVANFKKLLAQRYFDGLAFHRAIPEYLVQAGDPFTKDNDNIDSWGTGGPGYTIPFEKGLKHKRGVLSMARLSDSVNPSRDSNGSQFFVCLTDLPNLDGDYAAFGRVVQGIEILDELATRPRDRNDVPRRRVEIVSMGLAPADAPIARNKDVERSDSVRAIQNSDRGVIGRTIDRLW